MKPQHPSAAGICSLIIEPVTGKSASGGVKWVWHVKQTIWDRAGSKRQEVEVKVKSRQAALETATEQIFQCLTASVELVVEFTETTGDHEWKCYNIDGTAETVLTPRPDLPPARCLPLPTTAAEDGQRQQAGHPHGPVGRRPPRIGARPEVPSIASYGQPAIAETPNYVADYVRAEAIGEGKAYLIENPRIRGPLAKWFKKNESHELADVFYDTMQDLQTPAPVAAPARPPKPSTGRLVAEWGPLVAGALAQDSVEGMAAYLASLSGPNRQVLAGKIRKVGVPPKARELWEQAMSSSRKGGMPSVVARFLAFADEHNPDGTMRTPSQLRGWLAELPGDEHRSIGGLLRGTPSAGIPNRARDLYEAARNAPPLRKPTAAAPPRVPTAKPPTPRPPTPKPLTPQPIAKPPSARPTPQAPAKPAKVDKLAGYAAHYQQAVQAGTGATFLAGLIPVLRSNLRKYLVNRVSDPILVAAFDRDAPQSRPTVIPPPPVPVFERPRTPKPITPKPVMFEEPMPIRPEPVDWLHTEPEYVPELVDVAPPPASAATPDYAALMAQFAAGLDSLVAAVDAKAGTGSSEKLRTRSLFH